MKILKKVNKGLLLLVLIFVTLPFFSAEIEAKEDKTIKVAIYEMPGFSVKGEEGYSGYNIEYLSKLSKYTGWTYEFIECKDADEALEAVRQKKAHLTGGIQKSELVGEGIEFCEYTSGNMYHCMVTMFVNELIYGDYEAFRDISIGCMQGYIHQKDFIEYANENGYTPKLTYYNSLEEMRQALYDGKLDAMLISSMERLPDNERIIDKFFSKPFYYVTNEEDKQFTEQLKDAMANIKINESGLENELNTKYFDDTGAFPYTKAELEYLVNAPKVKVGINKDRMPIAYRNINGADVGISIDIFNLIEGYSGFEIELVDIGDKSVSEVLKSREVDLIAGISDECCKEIPSADLDWSNSYLETVAAFVGKQGFEFKADGDYKIGIIDNNELYISYVKENYSNCEIVEYKNVEEGLNAVVKGEIQGIIENIYVINAMLLKPYYSGLAVVPTVNIAENFKFVGLRGDGKVISILNKTISSISDDEINTCIIHYTVTSYDYTIMDFIYKYRLQIIVAVPLIIVFIVLLLHVKGIKKKAEYDLMKERSQRDVLTKLYNKGAFKNLVEAFLADEHNKDRKCAFIFIDIDNFKSVNDKLGHMVGDETLVKISEEISRCTRQEDIVARFGGDEFCVFAIDMPQSAVKGFATRTMEALSIECKGREDSKREIVVKVSASIGVSLYPDQGKDYESLLECADKAVYQVKESGKNGYKIFE